ncbi:hypothetical protein SNOG_15120 [Parastagonospora nodorum SN15]|uniref:Uncharacterized protein n=1 Tax=Phaeosphaeria nodorum (strain SN15 / ATCC MYA-4574 / FGSC 10173) TaxID=321614 RepID=Q0TYZ3_PHANO|nr:hypothetical protein SNOG_15120 [Parastagonospora nodorum SN15]EAT77345.2 hypothetical protein SNOG_15120 [Parastagonospora nodorum SN15]
MSPASKAAQAGLQATSLCTQVRKTHRAPRGIQQTQCYQGEDGQG